MHPLRFSIVTILFLFFSATLLAQDGSLLSRRYTPGNTSGTIRSFLELIRKETGIEISWSSSSVKANRKIKLTGRETTVSDVLATVLHGEPVDIVERGDKILLVPTEAAAAASTGNHTINGFIRDAESKEVLIGAYAVIPSLQQGTVTNSYGFYSLTLPAGNHRLVFSYLGYQPDTVDLDLRSDLRKDIQLQLGNALAEVKITEKEKIESISDHVHINVNDINSSQALLGENDVMRSIQQLPGVQCGIDGGTTIQVRGGDPGQNLSLLDGSPLYFVDHFYGLTSVFNTEAIKSVDFHKGAFPARFGGRLSSIVDVHTRDGDMERWGGQFTMGLVKGSLNLEGPIIRNRASLMLSARRTWIDAILRPATDNEVGIDFYDVNMKANFIVNKNNRLFLSFYNGRDQLESNYDDYVFNVKYRNTISSLRWTSILSPKLFLQTNLTLSRFRFSMLNSSLVFQDTTFEYMVYEGLSMINDVSGKVQMNWYPSPNHSVQFGTSYTNAWFIPTAVKYQDESVPGMNNYGQRAEMNEVTFFAEDEIRIGNRWLVRPGLHWANWFSREYNYSSLQPRLYASFSISDDHVIHGSFSQMAQFLHLISNNSIGLPADFWVPSTQKINPEEALLGTLGYSGKALGIEYSLEGYYKDIEGVTVYSTGLDLFDNSSAWQDKILQGKGWSYGAEFFLKRQFGRFQSTAAYTLSWNWRRFDEINGGKKFPSRYDRRHVIKLGLTYRPKPNIDLISNWTYMTGEAITLPDQVYTNLDQNMNIIDYSFGMPSQYTFYYTDWNNYRLPAIHRLDIGANFRKKKGKHYMRTWSVGMFNAYGRPNVMFVNLVTEDMLNYKLTGINLFRFMPYVTYKLNF